MFLQLYLLVVIDIGLEWLKVYITVSMAPAQTHPNIFFFVASLLKHVIAKGKLSFKNPKYMAHSHKFPYS